MRGRVAAVGMAVALGLGAALPATAQERGAVGVTMGYPAAIGVVWQATDALALRPDVSITWTSSESVNTVSLFAGATPVSTTSTVDAVNTGVGLSALVTVHRADRFRVYLVPRVAYVRSTVDLDAGLAGAAVDTTTNGWLASGGVGAQVAVHDHLAIFGEAGGQYSWQRGTSSLTTSRSEDTTRAAGLRSAVGVIVYF